jgi:hypothetical protein
MGKLQLLQHSVDSVPVVKKKCLIYKLDDVG